ncbi:uncharacterized protein TM35_000601200 [Trypanosoma theileri]|uniref:Mucin TcMUCII n=1 Tax=Trypanosoma theileri TaxID=67003 RepID=A0A1X0NHN8_9TRYP|nr:uncharacterized protein TM35_000601200 [Trypanosoma theileri]ORC83689.1 hypothetical protein TM35_000601200 [Trypanosoma theileri]
MTVQKMMRHFLYLLVLMLSCAYGCVCTEAKPPLEPAAHGIGAVPGVGRVSAPGSHPNGPGAQQAVSSGSALAKNYKGHPGVDGVPGKANDTLAKRLGISPGTPVSVPPAESTQDAVLPGVGVPGHVPSAGSGNVIHVTKSHTSPESSYTCVPATNGSNPVVNGRDVIGGIPGVNQVPCVAGAPGTRIPLTGESKSITLPEDLPGNPQNKGDLKTHHLPGVVADPKHAVTLNLSLQSQPVAGVGVKTKDAPTATHGTHRGSHIVADPNHAESLNLTLHSQPDAGVAGLPNVNGQQSVGVGLQPGVALPHSTAHGNGTVTPVGAVYENEQMQDSASTQQAGDNTKQAENTEAPSTTAAVSVSEATGAQTSSPTSTAPTKGDSTRNTPNKPNTVNSTTTTTTTTLPREPSNSKKPTKKGDADSSNISSVWVRMPLLIVAVLFSITVY